MPLNEFPYHDWPTQFGEEQASIYAARVEGSGLIKIGSTRATRFRLKNLKCMTKGPVTLLAEVRGPRLAELLLHKALRAHAVRGEWYRPVAEVESVVEYMAAHNDLPFGLIEQAQNANMFLRMKVLKPRKPLCEQRYKKQCERMAIARSFKRPRHELRPDIYPADDAQPNTQAAE